MPTNSAPAKGEINVYDFGTMYLCFLLYITGHGEMAHVFMSRFESMRCLGLTREDVRCEDVRCEDVRT